MCFYSGKHTMMLKVIDLGMGGYLPSEGREHYPCSGRSPSCLSALTGSSVKLITIRSASNSLASDSGYRSQQSTVHLKGPVLGGPTRS